MTATAPDPAAPPSRIGSVDLIRGAVMILMAIDHVRVFSGLPAGGPTAGIFFTRWVTHFCAPAFLFLAGTSAWLYGSTRADLPRFLLTRGLWLVVLELTVLRLAWTFNLDFAHYEMAGVIWAIGWCMILMAALVRLPLRVVGGIGLAIMMLHNLMDPGMGALIGGLETNPLSGLWKILYVGFFAGPVRFGVEGPNLIVLYSLIPWIGVMAAGYAFGPILRRPAERRNRICLTLGLAATALFVLLRALDLYGDPQPWRGMLESSEDGPGMPAALAFLNTTKYPASLLFLLMTLGPAIALIPLLERARGAVADWVAVFGRVPFFYYVLHLPVIHALALVVSQVKLGRVSPWLFANHPMGNPPPPEGYTWSLPLLYLVFAVTIALLSPACRWYAELKARRSEWWLRYL
jgi:uncharacterized membrane protein